MLILVAYTSHLIEDQKKSKKKTNLTEVVINFGGMTSQFQELDAIVNKL